MAPRKRKRMEDSSNRIYINVFENPNPASEPLETAYTNLWGKAKTLRTKIFKKDSLPADPDDPGAATAKRVTIMDLSSLSLLDLDLGSFYHEARMSKMLVRDEYELVEEEVERHRRNGLIGMVILGHPGVGKSFLLTYLLVLRLLDGKPTILQVVPEIAFLFCDRGIFSFDPSRWTGPDGIREPCEQLGLTLNREDGLLLLLDSDVAHISLPIRGEHIFVVQAKSRMPFTAARIEEFGAIRRFLKPWSWPEIAICNSFQTSPVEIIPLREVFDVLPASPRVCYGMGNAKMLKTRLTGIRSACSGFIIGRESRMVEGEWLKNMITCLWPNDGQRSDFSYEFASNGVARIFCETSQLGFNAATREKLVRFPPFAQQIVAAFLFGDLAHKMFKNDQVSSELFRLRSSGGLSEIHYRIRNPTLTSPLRFPLAQHVESFPPSSGPVTVTPGTYYQLDGTRRPAADALFIDNHGQFTLLKMSISDRASIETKELQDLANSLPVEVSKKTWQLIFVVPEGRAANFQACMDNKGWARKLDLYVLPLHLDSEQCNVLDLMVPRDHRLFH